MVVRSGPYIAQMSSNPSALEYVDFTHSSAFIVEQGRIHMKMMRLCLLLLLSACFATVAYAQDATNQDSSKAKASTPKSDLVAPQVVPGLGDRLIYGLRSDLFMPDSSGSSCAYMRTYRVKRQARRSDAVAPAGYTTCVPTQRFEMRSAVETRTDASLGEK